MMPRQMKTWIALSLAGAAALAIGGCKDKSDQSNAAGGKLLPRSVTDDMPPYDTVRSQSPLAPGATGIPGGKPPVSESTEAAAAAEEAAEEVTAAQAEPAAAPDGE